MGRTHTADRDMSHAYRILFIKLKDNKTIQKTQTQMKDNNKMELSEIECKSVDQIYHARKFHGQLSDYQLITPESTPWNYHQSKE